MRQVVTKAGIQAAIDNWNDWKSVYEYQNAPKDNPIIADPEMFKEFLREYSVQRTIRRGMSETFRKMFRKLDLKALLRDKSGKKLDVHEARLRKMFGVRPKNRKHPNGIRSVLSKIASFLAPHTFIAYDKYSRKGLNKKFKRSVSKEFESYADYLSKANKLFSDEVGRSIRMACTGKYPFKQASKRNSFHRRVLDVYLMQLGGRRF